jgi:hypothetical protein
VLNCFQKGGKDTIGYPSEPFAPFRKKTGNTVNADSQGKKLRFMLTSQTAVWLLQKFVGLGGINSNPLTDCKRNGERTTHPENNRQRKRQERPDTARTARPRARRRTPPQGRAGRVGSAVSVACA